MFDFTPWRYPGCSACEPWRLWRSFSHVASSSGCTYGAILESHGWSLAPLPLTRSAAELERENPVEIPVEQQGKVSTTDPDSTYATKGSPARLGYYDNYLVDNASCVIVGVQATPARLSHESEAVRDMIERYRERYGYLPQTLAAP